MHNCVTASYVSITWLHSVCDIQLMGNKDAIFTDMYEML